jgi:hypothetical protein
VNNTPRTHAAWKKAYDAQELAKLMVELSAQLEVELNVATVNEAFAENKAYMLEKELEKADNRIKRLEEAGNQMELVLISFQIFSDFRKSDSIRASLNWNKAKEAKP